MKTFLTYFFLFGGSAYMLSFALMSVAYVLLVPFPVRLVFKAPIVFGVGVGLVCAIILPALGDKL